MKARILWIEGKRTDSAALISALRKKEYQVDIVPNGNVALERVLKIHPDLAVINAVSLRSTGKRTCRLLREKMESLPILLIVAPGQDSPKDSCANDVLAPPFTSRKLANRVGKLLLPWKGEGYLQIGDICLDIPHNRVMCHGKETRLTPRLTRLLRIFMEHPGEVLERKQLFSETWVTQYTDDTRTLDTHISWLRQAIEEDPRKPGHLKTIRRLGYRFDI